MTYLVLESCKRQFDGLQSFAHFRRQLQTCFSDFQTRLN